MTLSAMRLSALPLLCGLAVALAACGLVTGPGGDPAAGSQAPASPSPSPTLGASPGTSPSPTSGPSGPVLGSATNAAGWSAVVTAGPDGQLEETLTVSGPLTVFGGCVATLTAWAETPAGALVPTPTPVPAAHCLAIALIVIPAGSSQAFTAALPEPTQPGTYEIHAKLDLQDASGTPVPVVTVTT